MQLTQHFIGLTTKFLSHCIQLLQNLNLSGPDLLESTRTLTARKPLNFGNSESPTRKLGKPISEFVFLSF